MNRFLWQQVNVTYKRLRRSFISTVIIFLILRIQNAARSQARFRKTGEEEKMSRMLVNKNMFSVEEADLIMRGILFHSSAAYTAAAARSLLLESGLQVSRCDEIWTWRMYHQNLLLMLLFSI